MIPICDLHCDLLSYLALDEERHIFQEKSLCSFPQLHQGLVRLQTLAIFSETQTNSSKIGLKQLAALNKITPSFVPAPKNILKIHEEDQHIYYVPSIENASAFAEEDEPLSTVFSRFDYFIQEAGTPLYVSLTWNTENRFGGGNASSVGLKKDGEHLIEFLAEKNVSIDLSHTSDALAHDILNHIEKKSLKTKVLASHSNLRSINYHPRNLEDGIAREIAHRGGVIGINLFRAFVGTDFEQNLVKMVEISHKLQIENSLCFGADFFCVNDFNTALKYPWPFFHESYGDATCYPKIQSLFKQYFSQETVENICCKNFLRFYENL